MADKRISLLGRLRPEPHVLDLRSLALFRILLGCYILYDIWSRLKLGRFSLAWYTSVDPSVSFQAPFDSPHGSPLHKVWFYRGSASFQIFTFAVTTLLALFFAAGYCCGRITKLALWFSVVAMQHRCMHMHDGSDTYLRHLLLWCCFLPMSNVWSIDSYIGRTPPTKYNTCTGMACLGLTMQIAFMYVGTVLNRTTDMYTLGNLSQSQWLPPALTAVHYSLSGSFATRSGGLAQLIRNTPLLSRGMTMGAMLAEFGAPIACLLTSCRRYRHYPAMLLFSLHFGLLLVMNLPNWQFLGMAATAVWLPSSVWDTRRDSASDSDSDMHTSLYKKTDGDQPTMDSPHPKTPRTRNVGVIVSRSIQYFLFVYMCYNWCGERGWIPKHDHGDIGEFLRFSQYWVMFGTPPFMATHTRLTAYIGQEQQLDVFQALRSGDWDTVSIPADDTNDPIQFYNMTEQFPSPRWERALDQWAMRNDRTRARRLCQILCTMINDQHLIESPVTGVELAWRHWIIEPSGSPERYRRSFGDTVIQVDCLEP